MSAFSPELASTSVKWYSLHLAPQSLTASFTHLISPNPLYSRVEVLHSLTGLGSSAGQLISLGPALPLLQLLPASGARVRLVWVDGRA